MKQLKQLLLVMAIALTGFTPAQAQTPWTHYSEWMANTQKSYVYQKSSGNDYWRYDDGLMYESILDTYEHYKNGGSDIGDATLKNAVKSYIDNCVNSSGSITNYESTTLDDIRPARMVYKYFKLYGGENLKTACRTVLNCNAFKDDVRVISQSTGYPWQHKGDYAHQVWLDGIFMGLPYWTLAGPDTEITSTIHGSWTANDYFDDAVSQMQITDEKTYEPTNGLWCHAWDATSPISFFWATKTGGFLTNEFKSKHSPYELVAHNGRSSHCWGRALGWFAMAIMETMDNIAKVNGASDSRITTLKALFKKVMDKVVETRDPSAGVWRCVIDVDATQAPYKDYSTKNNYLEATCSAMFTYCLLHGVAQGYLNSSYLPIAKDAYNKFINQFIDDSSTNLIMSNCMSVGGLDNDKKGDTKRDGSYAYYMSESIVDNDSKGVGPFIWASLEAEKTYGYTITGGFSTPVASDDIVQFRWSRIADDFTVPNTTPSSYVSPTFTAKTYGGTTLSNSSNITFNSDNTAVATVDDNGTITLAGEAGTANIKATMTSGAYVGEAIYTVTTTGTDTTKPTLSSSTPATGATDVAVSGNIVLTFSEDVTINDASNITLTGGSGTLNTASATVDGATITIPYSGLANSTTYTLNIAADAVKDLSENTNEAVNAITFTTIAPDLTAPSLSGHSITDGATDVATSGTIVLTFSEDVACTTNATLTPAGGSAINLTPTVSGTTVTYSYSGLSNSTNYTFNLPANSVADLAGNNYASAISFSFTTIEAGAATTATISWSGTDSNLTLTPTYTPSSDSHLSSASTTVSLTSMSSTSSAKTGYLKPIYPSSASTTLNENSYASISFNVASGYTFTPSDFGMTLYSYSTGARKAKVIISDNNGHSITSNEWTASKDTDQDISFSSSFVAMSGTVTIKLHLYGLDSDGSGKRCYIKSPITITGTVAPSSTPTPTTYTLTNAVNTEGYGTVSPASVASIPSGTATSSSSNTYTVNGTTVTATPTEATAEYTYTFSGWSGLPATVTANTTVTANFTRTANNYTLAWNSNGGSALSGDYTSGTVDFGTAITAPNDPTRDGYTFNGWNSEQNGSGTAPTGTMPAANTTYYAQWTENTPVVEQVATPSITGTTPFTDNTTATITCDTDGATIYYTTDGSTPTSNSTPYTTGINITNTTTIKAIAIKDGMTDSEVASATFTKSEGGGGTSATITYNLNVGTSASTTIKNSTSTTDATNITNIDIDQAHDGANGEGASDRTTKLAIKTGNNGETFDNPTNYELFKFTIATGKQFTPSEIAIKVANVGSTSANKVKYKATLTDESSHSIDGTYVVTTGNGTVEDFKFSNSSNVAFTGNVTLKLWAWTTTSTENNASAFRMGTPLTITGTIEDSSEPIIPTYTVTATSNNNSWGTVSVDKATAAEGSTVTITTSPASGYELTSLTATDGESNDVTITNNQFSMPASNVTVNATFAAMEKVATPSITGTTPFTDNTTATITCATTGATIHYTTDGTAPTASSTTYSSPIAISATTTVKAIAIKSGMTDSEVASATFTKSGGGGGGSGTVLFSQDFNDATAVAYATSTARAYNTTNTLGNCVGSGKDLFTSITSVSQSASGVAINSSTGGNNRNATGIFQVIKKGNSAYWSICRTEDFAATAPTAIKVAMDFWFDNTNSGTVPGVNFAIGDDFTDGLNDSSPQNASNVHSGFCIIDNSSPKLAQYNSNTAIYDTAITEQTWLSITWVINNTGEALTYDNPTGSGTTTLNNDCYDIWLKTKAGANSTYTKVVTNQAATTASKDLQNIYIGNNVSSGKQHEFMLDSLVVTDLSPAAMRTTTATIKAGKQYATFNTTMDIDFDETDGLQAFVVDNATKSSVHLREVTVVPANTALIIKGAPDTYTLYETKKATESVSDNQLTISNSTVAADNMYYALGTVNGVQGFHRVQNGLTIPTSYVIITDQTAKSFLNFEEEENIATGIDGFATDNGFIVIDDNTPLYNLSGQRVSKSYKGIVIINGKKVLRK